MTDKTSRVISIALLLASITPAFAQKQDEWNFLSRARRPFATSTGTLPAYLKAKAFALLDERERTIPKISTLAGLKARQQYVRDHMWSYLGGQPERTPLNARVVGALDRDGYRIEKVLFESRPGFFVTANLYLPKSGKAPYPAILYPLGHESGAKAHQAWQRTLASLARRGFVALAWDPLGQGERVQMYDEDWRGSKAQASTTEHTIIGAQCLLTGTHIAQYTIWDGIRALDYLVSRPEVDPKRIGCTGNSGGGTHTSYLSALDDRIQVAAPSCYITSWRRMLESIGPQDAEQVFPLWLRDGLDYPDFIYAFGGKPFLMLSAIRDFFPIGGARSTFGEASQLYTKLDLPGHVAMFEADDGHGYTKPRRESGYRWFSRWLQGTENTTPEAPVALATEEELQCTPTGQVQTSFPGAATVYSINRDLAEKLKANRSLPPEMLRAKARELAHYESVAGPVRTVSYGQVARPGYRVEKLTYESEPGIAVPALLFVPVSGATRKPAVILADGAGKSAAAAEAEDLVAKGYIVLAPDLRGFGETQPALDRRGSFERYFGDYTDTLTALLIGKTMVGMRALDVTRGIDLLAARSDVDASRIAASGQAAAAVPTLFAALFDGRISKLALDGMISSYESVVKGKIHQGVMEQIVPGALKSFDLPDIVAALAPRPVAIFNGTNPLGQELTVTALRAEYSRAQHALQISVRDRDEQPLAPLLEKFLSSPR